MAFIPTLTACLRGRKENYKSKQRMVRLMRARTVPHVEYEIFQHILDEIDISKVKEQMCPVGDKVAVKRFEQGASSAAKLIKNLADRRLHRLPEDHVDYEAKE